MSWLVCSSQLLEGILGILDSFVRNSFFQFRLSGFLVFRLELRHGLFRISISNVGLLILFFTGRRRLRIKAWIC